ncbi:hypothetical protein CES86_4533 [Brucella lupini]|uniref:Uncharacterized protein n=1 Tax=Brucella lupini TaxID=255457 RepID=A0A256GAW0_9HYPH|nr:hypothetical protein CES86_4533 [Brucella lupini]
MHSDFSGEQQYSEFSPPAAGSSVQASLATGFHPQHLQP